MAKMACIMNACKKGVPKYRCELCCTSLELACGSCLRLLPPNSCCNDWLSQHTQDQTCLACVPSRTDAIVDVITVCMEIVKHSSRQDRWSVYLNTRGHGCARLVAFCSAGSTCWKATTMKLVPLL